MIFKHFPYERFSLDDAIQETLVDEEKPLTKVDTFEKVEDKDVELIERLWTYFKQLDHPPSDGEVHDFAQRMYVDVHRVERLCYRMLFLFIKGGRSMGKTVDDFDSDQIDKGKEIEQEHLLSDKQDPVDERIADLTATKIAMDHLTEISDYYDRLIQMEKEAN